MDKDELIEKIIDMIFNQAVDLNDPQETIRQIKVQLDKENNNDNK